MNRYDSEHDYKKEKRDLKFKDYHDEDFSEEDEKELLKRHKKLGKPPKGNRLQQKEWPGE